MGDPSRHVATGQSVSLIPGVIYVWTPAGAQPLELKEDPPSTETHRERTEIVPGAEIVDGYRLVNRIGEGCTGEVWRAVGPGGAFVALKLIEVGRHGAEQELRSLALMPTVRHANLATIFGIWERGDWTVIGMDLADESLLDRFEAATQAGAQGLDRDELLDFLSQAARGIDFFKTGQKPSLASRYRSP